MTIGQIIALFALDYTTEPADFLIAADFAQENHLEGFAQFLRARYTLIAAAHQSYPPALDPTARRWHRPNIALRYHHWKRTK